MLLWLFRLIIFLFTFFLTKNIVFYFYFHLLSLVVCFGEGVVTLAFFGKFDLLFHFLFLRLFLVGELFKLTV